MSVQYLHEVVTCDGFAVVINLWGRLYSPPIGYGRLPSESLKCGEGQASHPSRSAFFDANPYKSSKYTRSDYILDRKRQSSSDSGESLRVDREPCTMAIAVRVPSSPA